MPLPTVSSMVVLSISPVTFCSFRPAAAAVLTKRTCCCGGAAASRLAARARSARGRRFSVGGRNTFELELTESLEKRLMHGELPVSLLGTSGFQESLRQRVVGLRVDLLELEGAAELYDRLFG